VRARVGGLFAVCANLACIYVCAHECMCGLHVSVCVPASHTLRGALAEQAVEQAIQAGVKRKQGHPPFNKIPKQYQSSTLNRQPQTLHPEP
jgi:hypothetical protein